MTSSHDRAHQRIDPYDPPPLYVGGMYFQTAQDLLSRVQNILLAPPSITASYPLAGDALRSTGRYRRLR